MFLFPWWDYVTSLENKLLQGAVTVQLQGFLVQLLRIWAAMHATVPARHVRGISATGDRNVVVFAIHMTEIGDTPNQPPLFSVTNTQNTHTSYIYIYTMRYIVHIYNIHTYMIYVYHHMAMDHKHTNLLVFYSHLAPTSPGFWVWWHRTLHDEVLTPMHHDVSATGPSYPATSDLLRKQTSTGKWENYIHHHTPSWEFALVTGLFAKGRVGPHSTALCS